MHRLFRLRSNRAQILLALGMVWIAVGIGARLEGDPVVYRDLFLVQLVPAEWRAIGWVVSGTIAILFALAPSRLRWSDSVGYAALYVMVGYRAIAYIYGWVDQWVPFGGYGYSRGWVAALLYLSIMRILWITSGWSDPLPPPPIDDDSEEV